MITDNNIKASIAHHHLFSSLAAEEFSEVLKQSARLSFASQAHIFYQGEPAQRFYLVVVGHLQLYRTNLQGQEKVIEVVRQGQTFAEALMFAEQSRYPVSAQAISPCELISVDSHVYARVLKQNPDAGFAIMANMSRRLRKHLNEVEILSLQNAQNRFLLFLQTNVSHVKKNTSNMKKSPPWRQDEHKDKADVDEGIIVLDIPKQMLASRLSIQPETFSRLMKRMTQEGFIWVKGDKIHIPSLTKLYACSEFTFSQAEGQCPGHEDEGGFKIKP
ncbi:Crp/Fnr family transcriptional regulator [Shewanella surugensis]|uniref:Crp/Fnr family transcriptional regulator n=1 Tax=Shewanella surugensis TaxID=212020 RepID=A0ABT0LBX9_9GAMM|nr:Crp/Fnr family transcriptional regulator [Shewanella surugensis]MCL1124857.1 Crp/Fnr family transcriptional regulator [Shewanella surugensis]